MMMSSIVHFCITAFNLCIVFFGEIPPAGPGGPGGEGWLREVSDPQVLRPLIAFFMCLHGLTFSLASCSEGPVGRRHQGGHERTVVFDDNTCLVCCVPSKGRVALTRISCLLFCIHLFIAAWATVLFAAGSAAAAYILVHLINVLSVVALMHIMRFLDARLVILFIANVGATIFYDLYTVLLV